MNPALSNEHSQDDLWQILSDRFGSGDYSDHLENDTLRLQFQHRSVRRFLPNPVTEAQLTAILRAAQSASHSSNLQAWSVVVVRDAQRRGRIADAIGGMDFIRTAPVFLVWTADLHRASHVLARAGQEMETSHYLEGALVPFVDIGIAAQNALLAAESLGLGGVFVGALRNNPPAIIAELGLPRNTFPALGMALGVGDPAEEAGVKPRLATSAVTHRDTYAADTWPDHADEYEVRLRDYYERFGAPGYSWFRRLSQRLASRTGLNGRHRLRAWLREQGFEAN